MKTNKKNIPVSQKGFTLIEILLILAVIVILVSIILVNIIGSREKAQDNSIFTTFKSAASPAYSCFMGDTPGVTLTAPNATGGNSICNPAVINAVWPDFSRYGWSGDSTDPDKRFYWCDVNSDGSVVPATGSYNGTTMGGNGSTGSFCFMLKNGSKYMWCTSRGCRKEGF